MGLLDYFETPKVANKLLGMLREKAPEVYGSLGGLLGTAPDQFEGSVLDPMTARVRSGAEAGFPVGTALQIAPLVGNMLSRAASLPTQTGMGQKGAITWHGGRLVDAPTAEKQGILINGMPALSTSTSRRQAETYARHNIGNLYKIDTSGMKIYTPGSDPMLDAAINANEWTKIKSAGFDGVNLPNKEIALFDYQGAKNRVKSVLSDASLDGKWRSMVKK